MPERHSIFSEATDAGFLGATAVAAWFLVHDVARGLPLLTPSVLGQLFIMGEPHPVTNRLVFGAIVTYTVLHFLLFLLFGLLVAWLIRMCVEQPIVRFALMVLFVVFELFFYVVINVVSTEVGSLFPAWTVTGANLLATAVMGLYFWRRYPELWLAMRQEPLGS